MIFPAILIALVLALCFYNFYYKRRNLPPGPIPFPVIGNIPALFSAKRFEYKFLEWKKKYGPIYTYWLGEIPVIAVTDAKLATQIFVKDGDSFVDRAENGNFLKYIRQGEKWGIIFSDGPMWVDQRRFALRVLRDFGLGKNLMEERILDEVQTIGENINREIDQGTVEHDFHKHTDIAVGSVINNLILGYRFTQNGNEEEFYHLKELTQRIVRTLFNPITIIARFNNFVFELTKNYYAKLYQPFADIFGFVEKQIKRHKNLANVDETVEPRDLVEAFMIEKAKLERTGAPNAKLYTLSQLRGMAFDMWFAGQETTSTTLTWGFAYLIRYPEAQRKVHAELDKFVGSDRFVTVMDRQNLVYLNAVIMEIQRTANIIAQNLFRQANRDVKVNGYTIKKGTYCITQISALHYDPEVFPNPDEFIPERFLDENGQLKKYENLMPFSLGKRICLGEGLAKMELFLFLANLLNRYQFLPGKEPPELNKYPTGGSVGNKPYKCRLTRRY